MVERADALERLLRERIVVLDGAMGTLIQRENLDEVAYRGERFSAHARNLRGNFDVLNLTRPDLVGALHRAYLAAGADIIRTNTFNSTSISQTDYAMQDLVRELNREGARIARRAADDAMAAEPMRPRFVAGILGPIDGRVATASGDLVRAYAEAAAGLLEGGVDLLILETVFERSSVQSALRAVCDLEQKRGARIALMVSGTPGNEAGEMLSGETPAEFWQSISHAHPMAVGLNCGFGAERLRPQLEALAAIAPVAVSLHPNAGLPNADGGYDDTPQTMAATLRAFSQAGLVNIAGGCCGTTPEFVAAVADAVCGLPPRKISAATT